MVWEPIWSQFKPLKMLESFSEKLVNLLMKIQVTPLDFQILLFKFGIFNEFKFVEFNFLS